MKKDQMLHKTLSKIIHIIRKIMLNIFLDWNHLHKKNITPWHREDVHKTLQSHLDSVVRYINRDRNDTEQHKKRDIKFLVPLCGKSRDLVHLYEQGFQVIGCECSDIACEQFFLENKITLDKLKINEHFTCFQVYEFNSVILTV